MTSGTIYSLTDSRKKQTFSDRFPSLSHKRDRPSAALNFSSGTWQHIAGCFHRWGTASWLMSLWFVPARQCQGPLIHWINKNLFSPNIIWWGDNFANPQHKGPSHVVRRCTLRPNQLKLWWGSTQWTDDTQRYICSVATEKRPIGSPQTSRNGICTQEY